MNEYMDRVIERAYALNASDIHLVENQSPIVRVAGELEAFDDLERLDAIHVDEHCRSLIYEPEQFKRLRDHKHVDLSFSYRSHGRVRVNIYYQQNHLAAALRLIPNQVPDIHTLGLPLTEFGPLLNGGGLILVTGVTGSGKSTTLAGMIDYINKRRRCKIITLEDPIEYVHPHMKAVISQREVGSDTPTFLDGLTSALRQDPDVILVGEMRDLDTISVALTAAETGHLILATLHSGDIIQAIERIIDVFPAHQQEQIKLQLATSLKAVIGQQLVPLIDRKGRVLACEVLIVNRAIRNMIRKSKAFQLTSNIQTGSGQGMTSMQQSLTRLYKEGMISKEEMELRSVESLF